MPRTAHDYSAFVSSPKEPTSRQGHVCPVCADAIIAAETSFYRADGSISYVWSCETCGYGFVTTHKPEQHSWH